MLAPFAIEAPRGAGDVLSPRIAHRPDSIRLAGADLDGTHEVTPLALDDPIHPEFCGPAR